MKLKLLQWLINMILKKKGYVKCPNCRNYTHPGNYCEKCGEVIKVVVK